WLGVPEDVRSRGREAGLIVYHDPARFLRPLKHCFAARRRAAGDPRARTVPATTHAKAGDAVGHDAQRADRPAPAFDGARLRERLRPGEDGSRVLGELDCMELLRANGIDTPRHWRARSEEELRSVAAQASYPCVVKMVDPVLAHKSDVGAVVVGIDCADALLDAWRGMVGRLGAREVLVAEQIEKGVEVLVGCVRDETFGVRLTIGAVGVGPTFIREAVTLVPPFDEAYLRDSLERLSLWAPIAGARGQEKLAADALVETVARLAGLGSALCTEVLREFECNP